MNSSNHPQFAGAQFILANLRTNAQVHFRHEHRPGQLIVTKYPFETPDQRISSFRDTVLLGTFQESRGHSILMDGIDLIKIENSAILRVEEPGPLAMRTLQVNQFARACVCDFDGTAVFRKLPIRITGERQNMSDSQRMQSAGGIHEARRKTARTRYGTAQREM